MVKAGFDACQSVSGHDLEDIQKRASYEPEAYEPVFLQEDNLGERDPGDTFRYLFMGSISIR